MILSGQVSTNRIGRFILARHLHYCKTACDRMENLRVDARRAGIDTRMTRRHAWCLSYFVLVALLAACENSSPNTDGTQPQTSTTAPQVTATAPQITTQPASQTVSVGQTATFSVVATGSAPLQYQWQENGTAIAGATGSSYTTAAAASADNGSSFLPWSSPTRRAG